MTDVVSTPTDIASSTDVLSTMSYDLHMIYLILCLLVCLVVALICHFMFRSIFKKLRGGRL